MAIGIFIVQRVQAWYILLNACSICTMKIPTTTMKISLSYICILYVYICTTSVLQINVAIIVTFDAHRWCVQLSFLSEGGALFSIGGASNKVTINAALVLFLWGVVRYKCIMLHVIYKRLIMLTAVEPNEIHLKSSLECKSDITFLF
jgi:hypothetical protein